MLKFYKTTEGQIVINDITAGVELTSKIFKKIREKLSSPDTDMIMSEAGLITGLTNPIAGTTIDTVHNIIQWYDSFKLRMLIKGLSNDTNIEQHLNELYEYVNSSSSRAYTVGNILRETIAANSPKICMLYGKIITKHIGKNKTDFNINDVIVCNALENASDFDLDNFKEIMTSWINEDGKVEYPKTEKERLEKTCSWAVYNRLFGINGYTYAILTGEDDPENKNVLTNYLPNSSARLLLDLIKDLRQVWEYDCKNG